MPERRSGFHGKKIIRKTSSNLDAKECFQTACLTWNLKEEKSGKLEIAPGERTACANTLRPRRNTEHSGTGKKAELEVVSWGRVAQR